MIPNKTSFVLLVCLTSISSISSAQTSTFNALQGSPVIDGEVDDIWQQTELIATDKVVRSDTKVDANFVSKSHVRCLWDARHLYVLAQVKDSKISTKSGNPWEQDSIEIFVDENKARSKGFQPDDSQYRISATGAITTGGFGVGKKIRAKFAKTKNGYLIEAAIEWHTKAAAVGREIGVEFQVNNDDGSGGRVSISKWNDVNNEAWQGTATYGTLNLVESLPAGAPTESSDLKNSSPLKHDAPTNKSASKKTEEQTDAKSRVPDWAADAVFYQIFPERFRNGDPSNDPTLESTEFPDIMPGNWSVTPWTNQWYARADWEKKLGDNFYEDGVFHRRLGGDLQGVIDKLDYLSNLGINTIYFNPVFYARSLHKYDGNSFHHVDPHFGPDPAGDFAIMKTETADPTTWKWTKADKLFLSLLNKAHSRNIRVIIDGVFNHTGRDFFAFENIVKKQKDSPYVDWYMIEEFDDPKTDESEFKYKGWWGVDTLPEFANNKDGDDLHPAPKSYVMTATRRWMDPNGDGNPSDGIDGWRLDVANEVPNKFWRDWNKLVRKINPDAYTVAEIWENAGGYLRDCGFSATMNYHGFSFPVKGFLVDGRLPASRFAELLQERMAEHETAVQYALQNLIDSHDTDRVASMIVNARRELSYKNADRFDYDVGERVSARSDKAYDVRPPNERDRAIQKLLTLFQMTFVGAPMVYYGTEAGMDGGDDPDDRMPMIWEDLEYQARTLGPHGNLDRSYPVAFNSELFKFYRDLISLRNDSKALRHGDFKTVHSDDDCKLLALPVRLKKNACWSY